MTVDADGRRTSILIVEDESVVALDLEDSLSRLGYHVVGVVTTADEAVRRAGASSPDLVLMDVGLQGDRDGVSAAGEIGRRWSIPVVFTTAYADDETVARARQIAPYGYLVKPFRPAELNATITMALRQHELRRQLVEGSEWQAFLLASVTDGVIATDEQSRVRLINPVAEALIGSKAGEALGRPIGEVYRLLDEAREPVEECMLVRALATGLPTGKRRFLVLGAGGRETPIEDSAAPIRDAHGKLIGAVTVFADITDRLQLEALHAEERERLESRVQLTEHALGETRAEMRALARSLLTAQEEERRRLARELHDDLGQRLAMLEMQVEFGSQRLPVDAHEARDRLSRIRAQAASLSLDLRRVSHHLHPSVLEDLGLPTALRVLVSECQKQGLDVALLVCDAPERTPLDQATSLYRITQEALRNASKHASSATVKVQLSTEGEFLRLDIEDDGPGFHLADARLQGGLGLLSMQERARLVGGSLLVRTHPGEGTLLVARVPLPSAP